MSNMDLEELGRRLKVLRDVRGILQWEAAQGLGLPQGSYSYAERGLRDMKMSEVSRAAEFYELTLAEFVGPKFDAILAGRSSAA